jgi:two-component system, NtrC family, sensor kinase
MKTRRQAAATTISGELLLSTALLFGAALLVAVLAVVLLLPVLPSPGAITLFLSLILLADLAILFFFLRSLLARSVLRPLEEIGAHAERIAAGDLAHRIPPTGRVELDRLVTSVNEMAGQLIREREHLAENVESLERTNRELVGTTDELLRTARMASVGTLAAGIAHEVGNPLGALRGALEGARRRLETGGNADEPLEIALEEARRIDAIIRSVLAFVRVDEQRDEWQRLDLGAEVRSAVQLLERRAVLPPSSVRIEVVPGARVVRGRPQLLEQVLVNLLVNAAQSVSGSTNDPSADGAPVPRRPAGGIDVVVRSAHEGTEGMLPRREDDPPGIDYSHRRRLARLRRGVPPRPEGTSGRDVVIEVRDRGEGIPREDLDRVFDPFFTTRPPGEGTGMGLAITARIVEELGGRLEIENRDGGGTLVQVRLPGEPPDPPRHPDENPFDSEDPAGPLGSDSTRLDGSPDGDR